MPVANKFVRAFDAVTRAGGSEDFELGLAKLELVAPHAVQIKISKAPNSMQGVSVVLDWGSIEGQFGLRCPCEAFQKYEEFCHHGWAALLAFDQSSEIEVVEARDSIEPKTFTLKRMTADAAASSLKEAVDLKAANEWSPLKIKPTGLIELSRSAATGEYTFVKFAFKYGDFKIPLGSQRKEILDKAQAKRIKRNLSAEKELLQSFRGDFAPKKLEAQKFTGADLKTFVKERSSEDWQIFIDGKRVAPLEVSNACLEKNENHYDFSAKFSSGQQNFSMSEVLGSLNSNSGFVSLADGSTGFLSDDWSKRLDLLSRGAVLSKDQTLRFSRTSLPLFKSVFENGPELQVSDEAKSVFDSLSALGQLGHAEPPTSLKASLRAYQSEGLFWLLKMSRSDFGGILADDMGLGKTIQMIAYLLSRRSHFRLSPDDQKPSLIVVPKSLVSNWKNEIEKFGPTLRVLDFAGPNRVIFRPQHFDVVLTTYHVLKNEIDRLKLVNFDSIILDEAQAIKNPTSQISKAVFQLNARQRFAMSGTPVENSLRDLFSLLHFTNPGLIPASFDRIYGDRKSLTLSREVTEKIAASVRPFILRRTKKQVLTELPDKSEQILICDMDAPQRSLYEKTRKHFKMKLKESANETPNGPKPTRVFEALLRLRQISCHPALIGKLGESIESTKVEMLLEHLEDIRASGNKALVFSQFTSFLDLLKLELQKAGIPFEHLDGQTRNRGSVVDRFNNNPNATVFLISLKAGGTGLNLTTASYVFLMDPWWNPAIESQAIDRAYRMGQTQKVIAYRLIAKGTIEEKILKLQDQKRNLAHALISEDDTLASSLSLEDLEFLMEE